MPSLCIGKEVLEAERRTEIAYLCAEGMSIEQIPFGREGYGFERWHLSNFLLVLY